MGTLLTPFIISNLFCLSFTSNENLIDSSISLSFLGIFPICLQQFQKIFFCFFFVFAFFFFYIFLESVLPFRIYEAKFVQISVALFEFLAPVPFADTYYTNKLLHLAKGLLQFGRRTLLRSH